MERMMLIILVSLSALAICYPAPLNGGSLLVASGSSDVNVIIPPGAAPTGFMGPPFDNRCCKIGRRAARQGYSCEVNIAILEGRLNMPHRYKMKFEGKSQKTGFDFARKFSQCSKTTKHRDQFYRCCKKDATRMDGRTST